MSDLIDRQAAIEAITFGAFSAATIYGRTEKGMTALKEAIRVIKALPTPWIPITDRLPEVDSDGYSDYVLVSFENFSCLCIGQYREDAEGGAFYDGDQDDSFIKLGVVVNAWMPLPKPYRIPQSETE